MPTPRRWLYLEVETADEVTVVRFLPCKEMSGQAVEIVVLTMAVYLAISLVTSLAMNWYNARMALVER